MDKISEEKAKIFRAGMLSAEMFLNPMIKNEDIPFILEPKSVVHNKEEAEHLVYMDVDEAKNYVRDDCEWCVANYNLAKKHKLRCIVNKVSQDVVGVSVY